MSGARAQSPAEVRITPDELARTSAGAPGPGHLRGWRYSNDGPHTRIAAHRHPHDRIATVVSGTWYFGYGREFDAARLRALRAGSFYTEPPGTDHFAETRDSAVMVQISGVGPTGTRYVRAENDPREKPSP